MNKKTLVIGASAKPDRYSNKAVRMLAKHHHDVVPLGFEDLMIDNKKIETNWQNYSDIDTVTLYLNPERQKQYYDYILKQKPKRIIFNPGTENKEFQSIAQSNNIQTLEACTLVLLSTGQY
jgi:predicted CoA-binding protein